jgi:tRNA 2-thiouridine synthesizing protein A
MGRIEPDVVLDTSGLNCPLPIIRIKRAMDTMKRGQILEVISTDPGTVADVPAFLNRLGHELLGTTQKEKSFYFYIKKK